MTDSPDVYSLSKVLDRALWILANSKKEGEEYLSADQIARRLTDLHKIATEADAVRMAFKRVTKGFIHVKISAHEKTYAIMKQGQNYLAGLGESRVVLIEPEKAYTSRRKVADFFQRFTGVIKICDPYVDPKTFDPLTAIPKGAEIKLLTSTVRDNPQVRREIEAYGKEYSRLEVRISKDGLHDRYVITKDSLWLVGHSLNGLGKKEAFIVELGADIRSQMEPTFDRRWATATVV